MIIHRDGKETKVGKTKVVWHVHPLPLIAYSCALISWMLPCSGCRTHTSDVGVASTVLKKDARYGGLTSADTWGWL